MFLGSDYTIFLKSIKIHKRIFNAALDYTRLNKNFI